MNMPTTLRAAVAAFAAGALPAFGQQTNPTSQTEETVVLSPFEVTSARDDGYRAANSITASRFAVPIVDVPQSISVVTADFMNDIGAKDLFDSLQYVSGFTKGRSMEADYKYTLRGVSSSFILREGATFYGLTDNYNWDRVEVLRGPTGLLYGRTQPGGVINVVPRKPKDRFEGRLEQRFDTNYSTRTVLNMTGPLIGDKLLYSIDAIYADEGSFRDNERTEKIGITGSLAYRPFDRTRIDLSVEKYDNDISGYRSPLPPVQLARLAPRNADEAARIQPLGLTKADFNPYTDWPHRGAYYSLPREYNLASSNLKAIEESYNINLSVTHGFSEWLNLKSNIAYNTRLKRRQQRDIDRGVLYGMAQDNNNTIGRWPSDRGIPFTPGLTYTDADAPFVTDLMTRFVREENWNYVWRTDLVADWDFLGAKHHTLVGVEYRHENSGVVNYRGKTGFNESDPSIFTSLGQAVDLRTWNVDEPALPESYYIGTGIQNGQGGNVRENLAPYLIHYTDMLDDRLKIVGGIRQDRYRIKKSFIFNPGQNPNHDRTYNKPTNGDTKYKEELSPQVGIIFKPRRDISLFASYATTFLNDNALSANQLLQNSFNLTTGTYTQGPVEPERGDSIEFGIKTELFDGRLSSTVSFYDISKFNLRRRIVDPAGGNSGYTVTLPDATTGAPRNFDVFGLVGEERSTGVGMDVLYRPTDSWQIVLAYSYTDARVEKDPTIVNFGGVTYVGGNEGLRTPNVPYHSGSLWNRYNFKDGALKGLGVGVGIIYFGEAIHRGGFNYRYALQDAYTLINANIYYRRPIFGREMDFAVDLFNLTDKTYLDSEQSYGAPFSASVRATLKF